MAIIILALYQEARIAGKFGDIILCTSILSLALLHMYLHAVCLKLHVSSRSLLASQSASLSILDQILQAFIIYINFFLARQSAQASRAETNIKCQ